MKEAHENFHRAVELNPSEPKHTTNALIAEYATTGYDGLPGDWRDRLKKIIAEHPDFVPAVRTHALILARDSGLDCAEDFIRRSPAFSSEPRTLLIALAEASEERGKVEKALSFITEAENLGASDAEFLSLKAVVLLRKALSFTSESRDGFHVDGYGPSELDIDVLAQSADTFDRACMALNDLGLPLWAEATFTNAAVAFMMAQRFLDARRHCEAFLKHHPNSHAVAAALAMILFHSDEASAAITHASTVYDGTKDSGSFKNLILILQKAEEYEKVLEKVRERQAFGFKDQDEQALALHLAAVAFAELGQQENAKKCISQIRETLGRPADAAAARHLFGQTYRFGTFGDSENDKGCP